MTTPKTPNRNIPADLLKRIIDRGDIWQLRAAALATVLAGMGYDTRGIMAGDKEDCLEVIEDFGKLMGEGERP